jgi:hypothetical protein
MDARVGGCSLLATRERMRWVRVEYSPHALCLSSLLLLLPSDTGYSALLTSTSTALSFNYFLSWVIVFLALYVLFAGMWKLLPGSGLSEGRKPAVASSRCQSQVAASAEVRECAAAWECRFVTQV